jgi:regulator of sirC expression with transglutaminase-like and TPR domain
LQENKEIAALLNLIDDPDEDVFQTVSDKIISFGKDIIPNLENLWETIHNEHTQERIESLIHRVHYRDLTAEFTQWKNDPVNDLIQGALIVAKYHYPDLNSLNVLQEIEKIRRNTWLELNSYLTAFEKVNVLNSILFSYYKIKATEISYDSPDPFLLNKTLESRKGNAISIGILYAALCELLDIPVSPVNIPRQFILAYFDEAYLHVGDESRAMEKIMFFIDPSNGQLYTHKDIESYFKRISVPPVPTYFKPMPHKRCIQLMLEELSKCFNDPNNQYKMDELNQLGDLLND